MKTLLTLLAWLLIVPFSFGQNDEILLDKTPYQYLIGSKYKDQTLEGFVWTGRTAVNKEGVETASSQFMNLDVQIYTSEAVTLNRFDTGKTYTILDIIVLKGMGGYSSCEGCYYLDEDPITVKTIHSREDLHKRDILLAFTKDPVTGIFTRIETTALLRNPKTDLLLRDY